MTILKTTRLGFPSFMALAFVIAAAIGAFAMIQAQSFSAGFSGADEPSHFLNGYFISSYLQNHFGSNPMAFATDFYIHYPKISIGHWPPAYYGLLSLNFMLFPATYMSAFVWNVLVAALPAVGIAAALFRLAGRRAALAGVVVFALTPLALEGQALFMVDQPLAATLVAATAVWIAYAHRPTWGRALAFAAISALAVLIKGNGWIALFIPLYQIALTGTWRRLLSIRLVVAAVVGAVLVVPWYLLTAKIAADGFNYQAGLGYAMKALAANTVFLADNISWAGVALALYASVAEFRARHAAPLRWTIVSGVISLVLATFTLQSIVPVDIVDRYVAPALPAVVVLALLGAVRLLALLPLAYGQRWRVPAGAALALLMVWGGVHHLLQRAPKADVGNLAVTNRLTPGAIPSVTVIDGSAGNEGAFIATMAVHDPKLQSYVVRASKLFADSNFMGSKYALKYQDNASIVAELHRLGVRNIVLIRANHQSAFPHSEQLRQTLAQPGSGYRLSERVDHRNRDGVTEVYVAVKPVTPNIPAVRDLGIPAKANALVKS
jgi:hypothetical protein